MKTNESNLINFMTGEKETVVSVGMMIFGALALCVVGIYFWVAPEEIYYQRVTAIGAWAFAFAIGMQVPKKLKATKANRTTE